MNHDDITVTPLPPEFMNEFLEQLTPKIRFELLRSLLIQQPSDSSNSLKEWVFSNITTLNQSPYNLDQRIDTTAVFFELIASQYLTNLTSVDLYIPQLSKDLSKCGTFRDKVPAALHAMSNLQTLQLDHDIIPLEEVFTIGSQFNALTSLNLSLNDLPVSALTTLSFCYMPLLNSLNLSDNDICNDDGIKQTLAVLSNLKQLRILSLNGTNFTASAFLEEFMPSSILPQLTTLNLAENYDFEDDEYSALFSSPDLTSLTSLNLSTGGEFSLETFQLLLNNPHIANLNELSLNSCEFINDSYIIELSKSQYLTNLHVLSFNYCTDITDESIIALANSPFMSNLTSISFAWCTLSTISLRAIADSPYLTKLTEIDFSCIETKQQQEEIDHTISFLMSKNLQNLTSLELTATTHLPQILQSITQSPYLTNLKSLCLSESEFVYIGDRDGEEGDIIIDEEEDEEEEEEKVRREKEIKITRAEFDQIVQAFFHSPNIQHLESLDLSSCHCISDLNLLSLSRSPYLTNLQNLRLFDHSFTDIGVRHLSQSVGLLALRYLSIGSGKRITKESVIALANSPLLSTLREITAVATGIKPADITLLFKSGLFTGRLGVNI